MSLQPGPVRLHLGCGEIYLPGYLNVDFPPGQHTIQAGKADLHADLTTLAFEPGSASEIRLHHVLEHFTRSSALGLLIRWYGWLEDEGALVVETPDFEATARSFRRARTDEQRGLALRHLFGSHEAPWATHRDGWYRGKFERVLTELGYRRPEFETVNWEGLSNITVTARKTRPFVDRHKQFEAAERLLRQSLVDDSGSERKLLETWVAELRSFDHS